MPLRRARVPNSDRRRRTARVPRAFVFIQRINLGLYALLGELGATGNYRRIASELWPFVDADPSSRLGHAEAAWLDRPTTP